MTDVEKLVEILHIGASVDDFDKDGLREVWE